MAEGRFGALTRLGPRFVLRRVTPIATLAVAVVLTAVLLPSLPTANPYVAQGNTSTAGGLIGPSAAPGETPGASPTPSGQSSQGTGGTQSAAARNAAAHGGNAYLPPSVPCSTYQGVFCDHIDTVFHWNNGVQCPQDQDLSPFLAALGVKFDPATDLGLLVPYINAHAKDLYPAQYASALQNGFYGRKINMIQDTNDGGPFCPDVSAAAAVRYATVDKAFAAIGGVEAASEGSGDIIAPQMAAYHLITMEPTWNRDAFYAPLAPYAWSVTPGGETILRHWVNLICDYLKNEPTQQTGDPTTAGKPRVFSIVHPDDPEGNSFASDFAREIQACGAHYGTDYGYAKNLANAASQAETAQARLKNAGTTTLAYFGSAVAALVGAQNDSAGNGPARWGHEWLISDYGYLDSPTAVDSIPKDQWKYAYGVSESNGYTHAKTAFCATPWGKIWCDAHNRDPNTYSQFPPADYELWWVNLLAYGSQLIAAGPNLTPTTIQQGLYSGCSPCPAEPGVQHATTVGYGPHYPDGAHNGAKDYEFVRWDPSANSPYESGVKDAQHYSGGSYEPVTSYPNDFPGLPDPHLDWSRWFDWMVRSGD